MYIIKSKCREFMLGLAQRNRCHKFTGIRKETMDTLNESVRRAMVSIVMTAPSKGKRL